MQSRKPTTCRGMLSQGESQKMGARVGIEPCLWLKTCKLLILHDAKNAKTLKLRNWGTRRVHGTDRIAMPLGRPLGPELKGPKIQALSLVALTIGFQWLRYERLLAIQIG